MQLSAVYTEKHSFASRGCDRIELLWHYFCLKGIVQLLHDNSREVFGIGIGNCC